MEETFEDLVEKAKSEEKHKNYQPYASGQIVTEDRFQPCRHPDACLACSDHEYAPATRRQIAFNTYIARSIDDAENIPVSTDAPIHGMFRMHRPEAGFQEVEHRPSDFSISQS